MKIRLTVPTSKESKKLKPIILETMSKVELDETDEDQWELIGLIEPGQFKFISDTLNQFHLKNSPAASRFKLETLSLTAEQVEGDELL